MVPADWSGWLLLCASFAVVPLLLPPARRGASVLAIWATLLPRHALAVASSFFGVELRGAGDGAGFHAAAAAAAGSVGRLGFGVGSEFYASALALLYRLCGPSRFLGQEASIVAFALSAALFVRLLDLLETPGARTPLVLLYGLLPACVVYTCDTMREAWQLLFFVGAVYALLRYRLAGSARDLLRAVLAACALGMLHNGLMLYAVWLLALGLLWPFGRSRGPSWRGAASVGLSAAVLAGLAAAAAFHKLPSSHALQAALSGDSLKYARLYRARGRFQARASYGIRLDAGSPRALASSGGRLLLSYMLAPFPWQIATGLDAYMAAENVLRLLLLALSVRAWRRAEAGPKRSALLLLVCVYASVTAIFALGTINWGTAIRHHVLGNWLLVAAGGPPLLERRRLAQSPKSRASIASSAARI